MQGAHFAAAPKIETARRHPVSISAFSPLIDDSETRFRRFRSAATNPRTNPPNKEHSFSGLYRRDPDGEIIEILPR